MSPQARKPAGSAGSTGGQFAPHRAGEADVDLAPAQWVQDGVTPHPSGGYVIVEQDDRGVRYLGSGGHLHRLDGPAIEWPDGTREWYQHGACHRDDGPAIEWPDGIREWYQHGRLHRDGGPAIELADGTRAWYQNDNLHRVDGPAVERTDGYVGYWVHGRKLTQTEFTQAREPA